MEKVRFACPRCQTMMQTGAEKVGYDVACPHCAHRFRLVESEDPGTDSRNKPGSSSDSATLPPTSFPQPGNQFGPGNPDSSGSSSSQGIGAPYPYKPLSSAIAPVVSQYPASSPQLGFRCPYCQTTRPPKWKSEVSTIGWIVFVVLLLTTCFGCVVGLFIRDRYRVCSQCKIRLG